MSKQTFHSCYHCKTRTVGCHAKCEAYQKEVKEGKEATIAFKEQKSIDNTLFCMAGKRMGRRKR